MLTFKEFFLVPHGLFDKYDLFPHFYSTVDQLAF